MIEEEIQQDVFEAVEEYRKNMQPVVFLHGCNARGVMGSGVAKQVRHNWPGVYGVYQEVCEENAAGDIVGSVVWAVQNGGSKRPFHVANAITQKDYGADDKSYADTKWIRSCLEEVDERYDGVSDDWKFLSVRVGCGLGGLEWEDVRPEFEQTDASWEIYYL